MAKKNNEDKVQLLVIQPEHFHAALLQKKQNDEINSEVFLFAKAKSISQTYINLINQYNTNLPESTSWKLNEFYGENYLDEAFVNNEANVVVLAGNNNDKIHYIEKAVQNKRAVFADKPLVINKNGYNKLKKLFEGDTVIYDMMTERYDVKNQIIKHLINDLNFSGGIEIQKDKPSVIFNSTHHYIKNVSDKAILRPPLYFDVDQQGEGLVDVTTHYIDLVQWMLSSEKVININKDIKNIRAYRWKTKITKTEFFKATSINDYPENLIKFVDNQGLLHVFSNGKIDYFFKNYPISISTNWNVVSEDEKGDQLIGQFLTNTCLIKIKPDNVGQSFIYITPKKENKSFELALRKSLDSIKDMKGLRIEKENDFFKIVIPKTLYLSHEDHFANVLQQFLLYRKQGLPEWEKYFMLAKYYITTEALINAKTTD